MQLSNQSLDWIVQNLFAAPPLLNGHQQAQEHVSTPALVWLRAVCLAAEGDGLLDRALAASDLWELCQDHQIELPRSSRAMEEKAGRQYLGRLLGQCLRDADGDSIMLDGCKIVRTGHHERDEKRRCDRPVKPYTFTRDAPCP